MATSDAPISIGRVALTVRDIDKVSNFYESILGLEVQSRSGEVALLGANGKTLLELRQDQHARSYPREAGLFHTAFLLPSRQDLGAWLKHAVEFGITLDGASDHDVSEALYLNDPEGNGIEVYADRSRESWTRNGNSVHMTTVPLDLQSLSRIGTKWQGAPKDTVIGHVHLRVGDVERAASFITEEIGMVKTFQLPAAAWFGSGGYHHHLASNVWHSQGSGKRTKGSAGLVNIELLADPDVLTPGQYVDPWGTEFTVTATQVRHT